MRAQVKVQNTESEIQNQKIKNQNSEINEETACKPINPNKIGRISASARKQKKRLKYFSRSNCARSETAVENVEKPPQKPVRATVSKPTEII